MGGRKVWWLLGLLALTALARADGLRMADGYLREMPPGQSTTAAYLTLINDGSDAIALVAATTPAAGHAEIHGHRVVDGAMRMERVARVEVPARGQLVLQPGGYHLMLIDLKRPLQAGETVEIVLRDEKGGTYPLQLPVVDMRQGTPAAGAHHHHH